MPLHLKQRWDAYIDLDPVTYAVWGMSDALFMSFACAMLRAIADIHLEWLSDL